MKKAFFFSVILFTVQLSHSQTTRAKFEANAGIDPSQLTYAIKETSISSLPALTLMAFNECYNNDYRGMKQNIYRQSFNLKRRQVQLSQPHQSESNEFKVKMNGLLEKSKIDLLFKHSFNTKISLVVLYIPIGKRSWPFGKA
jgi:hypothetical protein